MLAQDKKIKFVHMENKDKYEFGTWFAFDGFSALIKSSLFHASALSLLKKDELLLSLISGYYSLFHFGLFLVFFNPDKTAENHSFLMELRNAREKGCDPQKQISHNKLISILKEMGFKILSEKLSYGKSIREFYNYGPRVTLDRSGQVYFGNPVNIQKTNKIFPQNCEKFVRSIDKIICDEFKSFLQNTNDLQLYVLLGLWWQADIYLNDESLHLKNLYSEKTITSAKIFLSNLEKQLTVFSKKLKR